MVNIKKIDDKDLIFIKRSLSVKEEKEFSDFLKSRKITKSKSALSKRNESKVL